MLSVDMYSENKLFPVYFYITRIDGTFPVY
jgi:hypothetical protein